MFQDLKKHFPAEKIRWRVGATTKDKSKGIALAYIDARDVMERFDEVCGVENWQAIYDHVTPQGVVCRIGVRCGEEWVWKSNGAGETAVEGEKGSMSDAFKRAAVLWGVGRYLYDLGNTWVEIAPAGRSYKIADNQEAKLKKALDGLSAPQTKEGAAIEAAKNIRIEFDKADDKASVLDAYSAHIERIKKYPEAYKIIEDIA